MYFCVSSFFPRIFFVVATSNFFLSAQFSTRSIFSNLKKKRNVNLLKYLLQITIFQIFVLPPEEIIMYTKNLNTTKDN